MEYVGLVVFPISIFIETEFYGEGKSVGAFSLTFLVKPSFQAILFNVGFLKNEIALQFALQLTLIAL